ncbi:MAG: hypothetical protein KJ804_02240 [Proteobacteria bacterium]|nr:hypothetical protein [Pseudomonadota bacterium]
MNKELIKLAENSVAKLFPGNLLLKFNIISTTERPHSRLAQIRADFADKSCRIYFLKQYKTTEDSKDRIQQTVNNEYVAADKVDKIAANFPSCATIKYVSCFPTYNALLSEKLRGTNLRLVNKFATFILPISPNFHKFCALNRLTGEWLKHFQLQNKNTNIFITPNDFLSININALKEIQKINKTFDQMIIENMISFIKEKTLHIPRSDMELVHIFGDYSQYNFLADNDKIIIFDYDISMLGLKYFDAATYCVSLEEQLKSKFYFSNKKISTLWKCFCEGYDCLDIEEESLFLLCKSQILTNRLLSTARKKIEM